MNDRGQVQGALPIIVDDEVIGAIGVSADTKDHDVQIARAGLAALKRCADRPSGTCRAQALVQQSSCRRIGGNMYGVVVWLNSRYKIHNCASLMDKLGYYVIITDKLAFKSRIARGWWT